MSIFLTILAGVVTFVIGQVILRIYIEPVQGLRALIGETSAALINYGVLGKKDKEQSIALIQGASEEFRLIASKLESGTYLIPYYRRVSKIFGLPSEADIYTAVSYIIDISNNLGNLKEPRGTNIIVEHYNSTKAEKVRKLLKINVPVTFRPGGIDSNEA